MMSTRDLAILLMSGLVVTAIHGKVFAQERAPVFLEADNIAYDQKKGLSTYRGNVRLKRGSMRVTADTATVRQNASSIVSLSASGSPVVMKRKEVKYNRVITIRGDQLSFDANSNTVTVWGNVITIRGKDTLRSDRLIYQINDNRIIAERESAKSPVSAEIRPAAKR
jgi:lipopolysaccharide export system protein LptA